MKQLFNAIEQAGGKPYFVGGYVRDYLLGIESKDVDVEVFGLEPQLLEYILQQFGTVEQVGQSFGVYKLNYNGQDLDISVPRKEVSIGSGHKDFTIVSDPYMSLEEAASRRDFTINSIYMDYTYNLYDPFGGENDLQVGVLRATSDRLKEDPLRVLRGMQFCGRFNLRADAYTIEICMELNENYNTIAIDRVRDEWLKWAEKSIAPSLGLEFLRQTAWTLNYPELNACVGCPQSSKYHPEGDVWNHILACVDATADPPMRFAALTHDLGKPSVTYFDNDWVSPGHAERDEPFYFLNSIGMPHKQRDTILEMVKYHMVHYNKPTKRSVRRLMAKLQYCTIEDIAELIRVDYAGRPPIKPYLPENAQRLLEVAQEVADEIKPILQGRHLIDIGYKPGKHFGLMLNEAYEAQLDGEFNTLEGAISWFNSTRV